MKKLNELVDVSIDLFVSKIYGWYMNVFMVLKIMDDATVFELAEKSIQNGQESKNRLPSVSREIYDIIRCEKRDDLTH